MKDMLSLGLRHEKNRLFVLDQRRLPHEECWMECRAPSDMEEMIRKLAIRGAPLLGVAAALSLARTAEDGASTDEFSEAARRLRAARPTAINLMAAIDRVVQTSNTPSTPPLGMVDTGHRFSKNAIIQMAELIFDEDVALCEAMAKAGESLIADGDTVLTHCNTGGLATAGIGTALGVIRRAHERGKKIHVFVDETRPLLQGARLTAWELKKLGIPFTLICDNMAATLMKQSKIQKIFVGSDRIAMNGDAANKIGTYGLAVLAKHHGVPFSVVAPQTTVDRTCPSGDVIPIETRSADEVRAPAAPRDCAVYNPAFDVTPAALITAIVLDTGVFRPAELVHTMR